MNRELSYYYEWLDKYVEPLMKTQEDIRVNYELKLEHTYRVKNNILELGRSLTLNKKSLMLCELIGLYHDLGRFKQYSEYGTFSDAITGSHGEIGVQILLEQHILVDLKESEREIILKAIKYHNYFLVPDEETEEVKLYSRLIRDADKLDAFFLGTKQDEKRKYDLGILSLEKNYSEEIINDILNNRQVDFKNIKYQNDRLLSLLGLIFDLFYDGSFKILESNNYIYKIFKDIPCNTQIKKVQEHCENYIKDRIRLIK